MSVATGRRERGIVLLIVLFFVLLLTTAVSTFQRRATVDSLIARHRDAAREAEALARGGVELAKVLLLEDRMREELDELRVDSADETWALAASIPLPVGDDAVLHLQLLDSGSRLNVNALFQEGKMRDEQTLVLLEVLFERVVEGLPGRPEDNLYDPRELARSLVDFIDADEAVEGSGGAEDDPYQRADPPYRAANRPLLSLDELRLVEGVDGPLLEALRPYLTVHPWVAGDGINPNTAPPHVLGLLYHGVSGDYRLADVDSVADVLAGREGGTLWCDESATNERCRPLSSVVEGTIYPPPTWSSEVFTVISQATVGEVTRTVEAVLDRTEPHKPVLLSWCMR
ncbi:MAG: type II secretion system minor pseudopilin GspK [Deltaproteobacteria bacterium]|nr:type II secretion system minor pseudopilin GspK [Deltaproteobacteria bacterium]